MSIDLSNTNAVSDILEGWSLEPYDHIYGVPVSGMIVALMLSALSGIPSVPDWELLLIDLKEGKRILIVDDIKDSGETEKKIKKLLKEYEGQIDFKYLVDKTLPGADQGWVNTFWEADKARFHTKEDDERRAQQKKL